MVKLGVNIDHIATLRQQRKEGIPDILQAARVCEQAGADGITVHLREDRRHIQDADVLLLKKYLKIKLNLEMSAVQEIVNFACRVRPDDVCLVPEKRQELTTEGGLDVAGNKAKLAKVVRRLKSAGITVSMFIDPDISQVRACKEISADCIELHTGKYAKAFVPMNGYSIKHNREVETKNIPTEGRDSDFNNVIKRSADISTIKNTKEVVKRELEKIKKASAEALKLGLKLNAGHGLDYGNAATIARIKGMNELNIGFSGLSEAVRRMEKLI